MAMSMPPERPGVKVVVEGERPVISWKDEL